MARGTDYAQQIEDCMSFAGQEAEEAEANRQDPNNEGVVHALLAINYTLGALVAAVQENTLGTYEASGRF